MENEHLAIPDEPCGTAVVVFGGSSGAVEVARAELLASHGARALAVRWFGGSNQPSGPFEVPVELVFECLDRLEPECDRLALLGVSFGAELSLLAATLDERVRAVVALAPTPVVWAGITPSGVVTSHWTLGGTPVPFVPFDDGWVPDSDPPAYRGLYEQSMRVNAEAVGPATIRIEDSEAELVLVGGEDDQVWPSADFARQLASRRPAGTTLITLPDAGHRPVLPGEGSVKRGQSMRRGGDARADAALGALAWPAIHRALQLN